MAERKSRIEEGNKIIMKHQEDSIKRNEEVLKLLASEETEERKKEREEIVENINESFSEIEKELWKDTEFLETMKKLKD